MKVFVTGATGFIGSAVVADLIAAGHQVLGLTRSDAGASALVAAGAEPHRGDIEDLASLRDGVAQADGVIHCAFDHDFSRFAANCEKDARVIGALGAALAGSTRPLLITSGVGMGDAADGKPASEDVFNPGHPNPRKASELAGAALSAAGVNVSVIRLPQVHDTVKQGLITSLVQLARERGFAAYVGDGNNRWSAGHISDAARLYRLALEKQQPGSRYHAVGEEGVPLREIAQVIAQGLNVPAVSIAPEDAAAHFGWLAIFVGHELLASSALTQQRLGWRPTGPALIADLQQMRYGA